MPIDTDFLSLIYRESKVEIDYNEQWLLESWETYIAPIWSHKFIDFGLEELFFDTRRPQLMIAGCKDSYLLSCIIEKISKIDGRIIVVEPSPLFLQKLRDDFKREVGKKLFLKSGNLETIDFATNVFDFVISILSWQEYKNYEKLLLEFLRIVNLKGRVILVGYCEGSFQELFDFIDETVLKYGYTDVKRLIDEAKLKIPSLSTLNTLLTKIGYKEIVIQEKEEKIIYDQRDSLLNSHLLKALFFNSWKEKVKEEEIVDCLRYTEEAIKTYYKSIKRPFSISVSMCKILGKK